jgi:hypothetical protein
VSLGERNYGAGGRTVVVEESEDTVLQAFFEAGKGGPKWKALNYEQLIEGSGYDNAPRILAGIKKKYPLLAPAIKCPGKKGQGGLQVYLTKRKPAP